MSIDTKTTILISTLISLCQANLDPAEDSLRRRCFSNWEPGRRRWVWSQERESQRNVSGAEGEAAACGDPGKVGGGHPARLQRPHQSGHHERPPCQSGYTVAQRGGGVPILQNIPQVILNLLSLSFELINSSAATRGSKWGTPWTWSPTECPVSPSSLRRPPPSTLWP